MPDEKLNSSEIVRPFIIMQPIYDSKAMKAERSQSLVKQKKEKWNPVCEPPNSFFFFKEMNDFAL